MKVPQGMSNVPSLKQNYKPQADTTTVVTAQVNMDFNISILKPFGTLVYLEGDPNNRFLPIAKGFWFDTMTSLLVSLDGSKIDTTTVLLKETLEKWGTEARSKIQDVCFLKVIAIGENAYKQEGIDDGLKDVKVGDYIYVERAHACPISDFNGAYTNYFYINDKQTRGTVKAEDYENARR